MLISDEARDLKRFPFVGTGQQTSQFEIEVGFF